MAEESFADGVDNHRDVEYKWENKNKNKTEVPKWALRPQLIIYCGVLTGWRRSFCLLLGFCSLVRGGRRIPDGRWRGCGVSMVIFHDVGFCAFVKWIWSDCWQWDTLRYVMYERWDSWTADQHSTNQLFAHKDVSLKEPSRLAFDSISAQLALLHVTRWSL